MTAAMQGIDGLVFTGGVGEGSSRLRADTCVGLGYLGARLESTTNDGLEGDRVVSQTGDGSAVVVVQAREDIEIARQVRDVLGALGDIPPNPETLDPNNAISARSNTAGMREQIQYEGGMR